MRGDVGHHCHTGSRIEKACSHRIQMVQGDLRVKGGPRGVLPIDGPDISLRLDDTVARHRCSHLKWKLPNQRKLSNRQSQVIVDTRRSLRRQGCKHCASVSNFDKVYLGTKQGCRVTGMVGESGCAAAQAGKVPGSIRPLNKVNLRCFNFEAAYMNLPMQDQRLHFHADAQLPRRQKRRRAECRVIRNA